MADILKLNSEHILTVKVLHISYYKKCLIFYSLNETNFITFT